MPFFYRFKNTLLLWVCVLTACAQKTSTSSAANTEDISPAPIIVAANRTSQYLPLIKGQKVAIVANQTSVVFKEQGYTHLVDSLLKLEVDVTKVFAPEHGFRGLADAGEAVEDGVDIKTGLPVISLYGKQKKPTPESLEEITTILFDIQDVGVRFYTYIATLQLVMEAAAAAGIPVVVLDRPNPNAHFIDGPCMEDSFKGFLGYNNIPLVYGMTIGEYAEMINEEGWLEGGIKAKLTVVKMENYTHNSPYSLPIKPSPNLPNDQAIGLYPSLGLFEGTTINAGRGTDSQFQLYGSPYLDSSKFLFRYSPQANPGAKYPKHLGKECFGEDISNADIPPRVSLKWLIKAFNNHDKSKPFFLNPGMERHAGTKSLQEQIERGLDEETIRAGWQECHKNFNVIRSKYLRYP